MATAGNGSDEIINFKCCICAKNDIAREAETYCVECQDYYCTKCTDFHKMFPSAVGLHQFLDKSNFSTVAGQKTLPGFPVERCYIHNAKLLEMYCRDHDEIVCGTCVALHHRTCQDVFSVPDEVDNLHKKSAFEETKKKLSATMTKMEELKNVKELLVIELDKCNEKANASIREFRKEIEAFLDTLEAASIRQLGEEYEKIKARLECEIGEAEKYSDDLKQSFGKLSKSTGNKAQEFVSYKIAEKHISGAIKAETTLEISVNVEIAFNSDSDIKTFLQELKTFGRVSFSAASNTPRKTLYNVKNMKQINVRQTNDKTTCCVQGSCFTEKGNLLLADNDNKKLKHADISTMTILDHVDLDANPFAVCQISKQQATVSLNNKSVQFVSLGGKMTTTRKLNLDHTCFGLAYKYGKLFISDDNNSVYVHDMNGTMIRKITCDIATGNPIFKECQHLAFSKTQDRLFVSDYYKGLVTLDINGNYESTFSDSDLVNLRGVCVDTRGNVFVCGSGQSNIVQINEKPKSKLGVLRKVTNCLSTCFDPQSNKLVVTVHDTDNIEVYELE